MIDPGWVLNPSTWLLVGALCLLLEIVARWLIFLGLGVSGAIVAALVWLLSDRLHSVGSPILATSIAFVGIGLIVWTLLRRIFRGRRR